MPYTGMREGEQRGAQGGTGMEDRGNKGKGKAVEGGGVTRDTSLKHTRKNAEKKLHIHQIFFIHFWFKK